MGFFSSVPVEEALDVIEQRVTEDSTLKDHTLLSSSDIMDLLRLVVDTNIFTFQGALYKQETAQELITYTWKGARVMLLLLCPLDIKPAHWYR